MGLSKQAKTLNEKQSKLVISYLNTTDRPQRNKVIFLLSLKAGLRAKEISCLKWSMVMGADGDIGEFINLPNVASKGNSGRTIPLNKMLRESLIQLLNEVQLVNDNVSDQFIITTQRSPKTSAQVIVNMFSHWYDECGLIGCSSHSGRRSFITNCSRMISSVGGSLRDVQSLAGHSNLNTTQRYIDGDEKSKIKVVDII
jgi:integrase